MFNLWKDKTDHASQILHNIWCSTVYLLSLVNLLILQETHTDKKNPSEQHLPQTFLLPGTFTCAWMLLCLWSRLWLTSFFLSLCQDSQLALSELNEETEAPLPRHQNHWRTKWIEEGREQVTESERQGRQKGLTANPVHGQSFIFLPRRCRPNTCWISTPYSNFLFKKISPCSDNPADGLAVLWTEGPGNRGQRIRAAVLVTGCLRDRRVPHMDKPLTWETPPTPHLGVWGRQAQNNLLEETLEILPEVGNDRTHKWKPVSNRAETLLFWL